MILSVVNGIDAGLRHGWFHMAPASTVATSGNARGIASVHLHALLPAPDKVREIWNNVICRCGFGALE